MDKLTDYLDKLQQQLWRGFSDAAIGHAQDPYNVGEVENPDGLARVTGGCGDMIEIGIRVEDGRITDIRFRTDGCGATIACASAVTHMARDKTVDQALGLSPAAVLDHLGGMPPGHMHCAVLASVTLLKALGDYLVRKYPQQEGEPDA